MGVLDPYQVLGLGGGQQCPCQRGAWVRWTILENLQTTVSTAVLSWDGGRPVMKSREMCDQVRCETGRGCRRSALRDWNQNLLLTKQGLTPTGGSCCSQLIKVTTENQQRQNGGNVRSNTSRLQEYKKPKLLKAKATGWVKILWKALSGHATRSETGTAAKADDLTASWRILSA